MIAAAAAGPDPSAVPETSGVADAAPTAAADSAATAAVAPAPAAFQIGEQVCLEGQLSYLKSADPMPMLRPPDLVDVGEQGQVVEIRALNQLAVRFRRGTFLIAARDLRREGTELSQGR